MTDNIELGIDAKIGSEYKKFVDSIEKVPVSVKKTNQALDQQIKRLQTLQKEQTAFNVKLAESGINYREILKLTSKGGPLASLNNAIAQGEIKKFEASLEQTMTRQINRFARGMTDTIKAAENSKILSLKSSQSYGADNSLEGVKRELAVRRAALASNELSYSRLSNPLNNKQAPLILAEIEKEKTAVTQLENQYKSLQYQASAANQAKVIRAQTANKDLSSAKRASTLDRVTGDGGANLFRIQGELAANYMIMSQLFQLFNFGTTYVIQLDKAFRDLQAITNTTDVEMVGLKDTLIEVSEATKFSAVEVTNAATILGQAGFSTDQIKASIKEVTLFATAVGTNLEQATDLASSTISVFNLRAEEMGHVSNVLTGAINLSKLTVDKLALGIQYAGNAAFQSGATLEELVSVLGALSNAGIKSGSTLGTGLRQIIVELQDPTKKFREQMDKLGLTMSDIDVGSQGLIGVFENLRDAGFNSSTAFKSFETRAASAYIAIANNIDVANKLYASIGLSNAAAIANERQMQSLGNTMDNLTSSFGTFLYRGSEPFVQSLVLITRGLTGAIVWLNKTTFATEVLMSTFIAFGGILAGLKLTNLVRGLFGAQTALSLLTFGVWPLIGALTALAGTILIVGHAFGTLSGAKRELEEATAAVAESEGAFASQQARIESVDEELNRLSNRYVSLKGNNAALGAEVVTLQAKFGEFSSKLASGTITTIDDLIAAMQEVRGEFSKLSAEQAKFVQLSKQLEFSKLQKVLQEEGAPKITDVIWGMGRVDPNTVSGKMSIFARNNSKTLGDPSKLDSFNATEDQVNAYNIEVNNLLATTYANIAKVRDYIQKGDAKAKADGAEALKILNNEIVKLNNARVKAGGLNVANQITEVTELASKSTATFINNEIERYRILFSEKKQMISDEKDPGKKAALGKELVKLKEEMDKFLLAIVDSKGAYFKQLLFESGGDLAPVNSFGAQIQGLIASLSTDYETKIDEVEENTSSYVKEQEKFFDGVAEIQKSAYERLKTSINNNLAKFDRQITNIDNNLAQARDATRGSLRGQYTDAELSMFEDQKVGVQNAKTSQQILNNQALLPGASDNIASAEKYLAVAQAKHNSDKKSAEAIRDLTSAQKDLLAAQQEKFTLEQEILTLQDQLNLSTGESIIAHQSLGDQIQYTLDKYAEQKALQTGIGTSIQADIVGALEKGESAFASFIESSVSGTKSLKGSFADMARSIVADMLKIASQKAAAGIFGSIVGSLGGLFGGGGVTSLANPNIAGTSYLLKTGGYVHKASGGAMLGRDSVKAMLEPGEYVLRKQAVDMLGRENLDTVNALGRRTLSQTGANNNFAQGSTVPSITNVYVVAPEEKPSLTKNDVLVVISEDLLTGGTTKKLVKSIATGGM